jgi:Icc protein
MFAARSGLLSLTLLLQSCGDPSPWGTHRSPTHSNLTQKHLDMLQTGTRNFEPFTVALTADSQVHVGDFYNCRTAINRRDDIAFSFLLGDLTDRSLKPEFDWVAEIAQGFRRPILTVVGNHDGLIFGASLYRQIFGPLDYSFIFNDVKFVVWNNNTYEWGYPDFDWLESEIRSHPRVVIVAHQPPGSVERYEDVNDRWKELYQLPNVLGSIHGHLHKWGYQEIHGKPALIVERVKDTNWGLMKVTAEGLLFETCKGAACVPYP